MKTNKILLVIMISIILICIPKQSFSWLQYSVYEKSNIINDIISWIMKILAFLIGASYITIGIQYLKNSKQEKKQKIRKVITWLMVIIIEVIFLVSGSVWVKEVGMEKYWTSGERYQFNETDAYISNGIRIVALITIVSYIVTSVIYFIRLKTENIRKIENLVRWQVITSALVAGLLILATRW